jgi:hypothetical protein
MPSTLFDSAGLAIVAYVQVKGSDGSSSSTALANSGVTTTKVPGNTGDYLVQLSTAVGQDPSRDLIFVQPTLKAPLGYTDGENDPSITFDGSVPCSVVTDADKWTKEVQIGSGTTALDCDFNVLILRTMLP